MMKESVYLECACHSLEHTFRVMILDYSDPDHPALFKEMNYDLDLEVLLVRGSFLCRLREAIRYLFSGQLSEAETLLKTAEVAKLHEAVHEYERLVSEV